MPGYLIVYAIFAAWVFRDAKKRQMNGLPWAAFTVLFGPVTVPIWLARRPLKEGEVREGGTGWNVLKNFALMWTLTMFVWFFAGMAFASKAVGTSSDKYEQAGAAIGGAIGGMLIFGIWFVGLVSSLVLGFFLKKNSIVEKGPTGPLAR